MSSDAPQDGPVSDGLDPETVEADARAALHARFPEAAEQLDRYVAILRSKGIEWGLLGPREGDKLWSRHVSNSLAIVDVLGQGIDVADVGSGAGLPGIPVAIVRPDVYVTLLEPLLRRTTFLEETVEKLLLRNVRVVRLRAEDCDEQFDVVTCRAVAPLEKLLRWTTPLFYPAGELVALKGSSAEREVSEAGSLLSRSRLRAEILEVRAAPDVEGTRVIRVTTKTETCR
ncbi:16S rRNA (guanine(527)-N(7))-methyltransferase RsmG [Tessaracoccus antarcticus]|uniref:Ribosomal RNA small subunit methyltransferase G n=1 Tax=Tessaracoccus antarcticus TaxID=2479848 RepID=A0A3M0GK26_9ACTN|nr:16S rRNA (guanine(527)-N(7))-methyltransferase RsmG [Tessaracoccus antarcticus]RMB61499.1 16S rRNA (guanine(527)-N(7))-methyltransferase RsmG [Tessaracoccus antarcticus]